MEKLKSIIPWELKKSIQQTTPNDLASTCSSLHDFFSQSPLFHSMIQDLTNTQLGYFAKNKETALEMKCKGNSCFVAQDYSQSLHFYSQALRVAPIDATDKNNNLVATLFVNRASSLHKLDLLEESLRDCNRAISINPRYAKAWYRRGKVKATLLNYEEANCDLKVALDMEGTCSGKKQIENDIKLISDQNTTGSSSDKSSGKTVLLTEDDMPQEKIDCMRTKSKGRGMASLSNIPPASLLHREEPFAAILLKNCRESHCHYCFNELPADTVPCRSCSMPLYCSETCQLEAGGQMSRECPINDETLETLSSKLASSLSEVTLESHSITRVECFAEHGHECHGVNWPVVLPSDVVLAGRIFVRSLESEEKSSNTKNLDLSHNYVQLLPDSKLELHVYSIALLHCLYFSYGPKVELSGACAAKMVILISQVKVNSMAIVRMKCIEKCHALDQRSSFLADAVTSILEQVKVGQAIYLMGSLFNHSCVPNINAYFISRTLLIRTTEYVPPGCPLELSYGPEVGKLDYRRRQQFLQDNYSFKCECSSCLRLNFPDLVLNAFHCARSNCCGVVLDENIVEYERNRMLQLQGALEVEQTGQVDMSNDDGAKNVASLVFKRSHSLEIQSGCCLNCGTPCDLKSLHATADEAELSIRRLQEAVTSNGVHPGALSNALSQLKVLKSTLHPYNKKLAEALDILAEAFCSVGETRRATDCCLAAIEILKELYRPGHIAVGNELVKLSSLQLALADADATATVNQIETIFLNYYGRHAELMFPYLQHLKEEVQKLAMKHCQ